MHLPIFQGGFFMKKILSTIVALVIVLTSMSAYASVQTYTTDVTGISFDMPEHWTCTDSDNEYVRFAKFGNSDLFESLELEYGYVGPVLTINDVSDEVFKEAIDAGYLGDEAITDWVKVNNPNIYRVSVSTVHTQQERVTYGNNDYYRYERVVSLSSYGYNDTTFYFTVFATIHNGYIYFFRYQRDLGINNYDDVVSALASVRYNDRDITITVNGKTIHPDTEPVILSGRTMVPIRAVAEELGYDVEWDSKKQVVIIKNEFKSVFFAIGLDAYVTKEGEVTGEALPIDVAPFISGGRTYLPLRAVSDALGADISWDPDTYTATIEADATA